MEGLQEENDMESISEENERNVFEKYLKAYFCEHPEDTEGHFPKMHYIDEIYYYIRKHKGLSVLFNYDMESDRLCTAYFKVYDHSDYALAKRAAKLHFKDSGMEYHRNPYEKQQWILNSKDIKRIRDLLEDINDDDYYLYHDYNTYTNWKILCYQWDHENGLIPASASITDYYSGKYDNDGSQLNNAYIPSTQKIPETWNYEPPEACADSKDCKIVFRIGDIVNITKTNACSVSLCVVRETVLIDIGAAKKYVYDVSPIDSDDEVYTYEEHELQFQYHDTVWEEHFTETVGNGLPEWRGELYNIVLFSYDDYDYVSYEKWRELREAGWDLIKIHDSDTIPPAYTAPFIWIPASKVQIKKKDGKCYCNENFKVASIIYSGSREITGLSITDGRGKSIFEWKTDNKDTGRNEDDQKGSAKKAGISKAQMDGLETELQRTGVAMEAVKERYNITDPKQMSEELYNKVMNALSKTKSSEAA